MIFAQFDMVRRGPPGMEIPAYYWLMIRRGWHLLSSALEVRADPLELFIRVEVDHDLALLLAALADFNLRSQCDLELLLEVGQVWVLRRTGDRARNAISADDRKLVAIFGVNRLAHHLLDRADA